MKKILAICLAGLFLLLPGCGGQEKMIQGRVENCVLSANRGLSSFTLQGDDQNEYEVQLNSKTGYVSRLPDVRSLDFQKNGAEDLHLTVRGTQKGSRKDASGRTIQLFRASSVQIDGVYDKTVYILKDGTQLAKMKGVLEDIYYLPDGRALLHESKPAGPAVLYDPNSPMVRYSTPAELEQLRRYYDQLGLLYNIDDELERAYASYNATQDKSKFFWQVSQDLSLSAQAPDVNYYKTTLSLPIEEGQPGEMNESVYGAAFSLADGAYLPPEKLFKLPYDEVINRLMERAKIKDKAKIAELKAALRPEYFVFNENRLELSYPAGSLKDEPYAYILSFTADELKDLMPYENLPKYEPGV